MLNVNFAACFCLLFIELGAQQHDKDVISPTTTYDVTMTNFEDGDERTTPSTSHPDSTTSTYDDSVTSEPKCANGENTYTWVESYEFRSEQCGECSISALWHFCYETVN